MNTQSMTISHQNSAPWQWLLGRGEVTRFERTDHARWVHVAEGRVWLTRSGAGPDEADVWLEAGQRHLLPAGTEWVAEGWPQACVELVEAPAPRLSAGGGAARWRVWPPALRAA